MYKNIVFTRFVSYSYIIFPSKSCAIVIIWSSIAFKSTSAKFSRSLSNRKVLASILAVSKIRCELCSSLFALRIMAFILFLLFLFFSISFSPATRSSFFAHVYTSGIHSTNRILEKVFSLHGTQFTVYSLLVHLTFTLLG